MAFSINRRSRQQQTAVVAEAIDDQLAAAEAALNTLLDELREVRQTLDEHQQQRQALLSNDGDLQQITELDRADYLLRLRDQQLERQLPALQDAVNQARAAEREAAWQAFRPKLRDAELQLASAIGHLFSEFKLIRQVHNDCRHAGFGDRLREFLAVPPDNPLNDYSLREFVKHAGRERQPVAAAQDFSALALEEPVEIPPDPRWVASRPDWNAIRAISPLAPPQAIRIIHGPANVVNLGVGLSRVLAGEEHVFPAKAAAILVTSGVAEYVDSAEAVEALVATA